MLVRNKQVKAENIVFSGYVYYASVTFGNHPYALHAEAVIAPVSGSYGQTVFKLHFAAIIVFQAYCCKLSACDRRNAYRPFFLFKLADAVNGVIQSVTKKRINIARAPSI